MACQQFIAWQGPDKTQLTWNILLFLRRYDEELVIPIIENQNEELDIKV